MFDRDHRRTRRRVAAHVDGELPVDDAAQVEAHLARCPDCARDAELLRRIKASLRRITEREPTDLAVARLRRWIARHLP